MKDWNQLKNLPEDKIFGLNKIMKNDKNPNLVNLTVGKYRDENGKAFILPSVWLAS